MLKISAEGAVRTCDHDLNRRDFLEVGSLGAVGLGLPQLLAAKAQGAVRDEHN